MVNYIKANKIDMGNNELNVNNLWYFSKYMEKDQFLAWDNTTEKMFLEAFEKASKNKEFEEANYDVCNILKLCNIAYVKVGNLFIPSIEGVCNYNITIPSYPFPTKGMQWSEIYEMLVD